MRYLIILILFSYLSKAETSDLDSSFADKGYLIEDYMFAETGWQMALQSDGKVVLSVARSQNLSYNINKENIFSRLNTDGSYDHSFGDSGLVYIDINIHQFYFDMALNNDDEIFFAGSDFKGNGSFIKVGKLNNDGSIDSTFGDNGVFSLDLGHNEVTRQIRVQDDGKIVVGGYFYPNSTGSPTDIYVFRLNEDGSLDSSFGNNGITYAEYKQDWYNRLNDMQILSDGSIIIAGETSCDPCGADKNTLVKLKPNGSIDNYFGMNGWVSWNINNKYRVNKVVQKPDGKISVLAQTSSFEVYQFNLDGSWDTGFGINGKVIINNFGNGKGLVAQADGKLIVASVGAFSDAEREFFITRLSSDGSLDQSFNSTGQRSYKFDGWRNSLNSADMLIQPDGGLLLSGDLYLSTNTVCFVARIKISDQASNVDIIPVKEVKQLKVYPNPLTSSATIEFPNYGGGLYKLYVFDMIGNVVKMVDGITTDQYTFYKEDLTEGLYFLEMSSKSETLKGKILIK